MAVDLTLKSAGLTARDATPPTAQNPGSGGVATKKFVQGYIASVTAALSVTSVIRLVQVPAHCYIKSVKLYSEAQGAGAFDVGLYNVGVALTIDQDFFGSAVSCAGIVAGTDITHESAGSVMTVADRILPLWQAAGVSTEPAKGTMYEIAAVVTTTDVTTGTGALGVEVEYVE